MRDTITQQLMSEEVVNRMTIQYGLEMVSADQNRFKIPFNLFKEIVGTDGMVGTVQYSVVTNGYGDTNLSCEHKPFDYRPYRHGRLRCLQCGAYKGGVSSSDEYERYLECVKVSEYAIKVQAKRIKEVINMLNEARIETYQRDHVGQPVHVKDSLLAGDWQKELAELDKKNEAIRAQIYEEVKDEAN